MRCPTCDRSCDLQDDPECWICQNKRRNGQTVRVSQSVKVKSERRQRMRKLLPVCRSCDHWTDQGCGGCDLLTKPCGVIKHLLDGHGCPAEDPRFPSAFGHRVGFLAATYEQTGGTETWHQTLLSRLGDRVSGFAVSHRSGLRGPIDALGCEAAGGLDAMRDLSRRSDTLVVWGIGEQLGEVLAGIPDPPRVISVSHCDHRSDWTVDFMRKQGPWSDHAVYICPTGIETVPQRLRNASTLIPNAPDPARIQTTRDAADIRRDLGIPASSRVFLVTSRVSQEKRIDVLVDAMDHLDDDHLLLVAGRSQSWCREYLDKLKQRQSRRFRMIPEVDHPGDLLSVSDAVLSASSFEGYGLAMAEAMLAEVPVIATPVGLLEFDQSLAKVVSLDAGPREWAQAIKRDFDDHREQLSRVIAAEKFVSAEHSVDSFVRRWERLLENSDPV